MDGRSASGVSSGSGVSSRSSDSTAVISTAEDTSPLSMALNHLRCGDTAIQTCYREPQERWFSETTKADIFEVGDGKSHLYRAVDDADLRLTLKNDVSGARGGRRLRIIFLDGDEDEPERLPITCGSLQLILDTYKVAPRFSFYLSRQQMAGSSMHLDPDTNDPCRLEFWYSAVIRSLKEHDPDTVDKSRSVMNWLRCCVWSDFNAVTGDSTCIALRYPTWMKEAFFTEFAGSRGGALVQHPMLLHASWMERLSTHTRDINAWFSNPLYEAENQTAGMKSPADLFHNTRELTMVYRQIRQVLTDYEVFKASAKSMTKQNESMATLLKLYTERSQGAEPSEELQHELSLSFKQVRKELKMGNVYLTLYLERCNSGIADFHSVSNQHSAEVSTQQSITSYLY